MRTLNKRLSAIVLGLGLALGSVAPAVADDSEIYVGAVSNVKPNILLLLDTSGSMAANDVVDDHATFSPTGNYGSDTGNCNGSDSRIFFTVGQGAAPPNCASNDYIRISAGSTTYQTCDKLARATAAASSAPSGRWIGKAAHFNTTTRTWEDLLPGGVSRYLECAADNGIHGQTTSSTNRYARNGSATALWTNSSAAGISWASRTTYTFYSERWVRWNQQPPTTVNLTRIQAVKNAVLDIVSSIDDVNIGVMRFAGFSGSGGDAAYQGGLVTTAISDVEGARASIITEVAGFNANSATPLSEFLREAGRYWAGEVPVWGHVDNLNGTDDGQIDSNAYAGGRYKSPITESCQRNFNILLTDGRPTWDAQDNASIETLFGGACTGAPGDPDSGPGSSTYNAAAGKCLDEMSAYLARDTTDLRPALDGKQSVKTYTIGFGNEGAGTFTFLDKVAADGGGQQYLAKNTDQLTKALTDIVTDIANVSSTFSTASIGVNSFNRAASRDDLYFAVFNSDDHLRWDGNLKKYKLAVKPDPDGAGPRKAELIIIGSTSATDDVINPLTGFFEAGTRSFWSTLDDENDVLKGGAVDMLPATRTVFTHIGANPAGTFANMIAIDNAAVTDAILGTAAPSTITRAQVMAFAKTTPPKRMGDPLHSQPAVVTYGGTAAAPDEVVFVATNDGFLHAVDAASGAELWAFVPQELLGRVRNLILDPAATTRSYGLDGDIRILRLDKDSDGIIEPTDGDVLWLFTGMRRGGKFYYGFDVTLKNAPKLMWKIGPSELDGIGETWSAPTIARVAVSGASQNNQKLVLVFGGGYDAVQENYTQVDDAFGNNLWMVDAKTGLRLWSAGDGAPHNLQLPAMTNSITGRISTIDTNGDGFIDRMYAADLGGRIFRFDVFSGNAPGALVTGSLFANLGEGLAAGSSPATPVAAATRRFYNAPDVALIQRRGSDPYYNIAIGSGYRGHPLHKEALDRFYSLRDKQPFTKYATNNAVTPITEGTAGLVNITANPITAVVPATAPGWMLVLDTAGTANPANVTGQKVLNEATTVNGVILFSTYEPQIASTTEPCRPKSVNRVYALNVDNGRPALDLNNDGVINNADLFESVNHEGILGGVNVGVLRGSLADALGGGSAEPVCIAGMHILGKCPKINDSIRTYWRRDVDQQ